MEKTKIDRLGFDVRFKIYGIDEFKAISKAFENAGGGDNVDYIHYVDGWTHIVFNYKASCLDVFYFSRLCGMLKGFR